LRTEKLDFDSCSRKMGGSVVLSKKILDDHHPVCRKHAVLVLCHARRTEEFGPSCSWRKKIEYASHEIDAVYLDRDDSSVESKNHYRIPKIHYGGISPARWTEKFGPSCSWRKKVESASHEIDADYLDRDDSSVESKNHYQVPKIDYGGISSRMTWKLFPLVSCCLPCAVWKNDFFLYPDGKRGS
jgi:hypothetical protein